MIYNVPLLPYNEEIKKHLDNAVNLILRQVAPESLILFGSYARASAKCTSDFDILVLTKEEIDRGIRGDICCVMDELKVDVVFYTVDNFNSSNCYFVKEIKKDGVLLWKN